jgi:hypothetical protein
VVRRIADESARTRVCRFWRDYRMRLNKVFGFLSGLVSGAIIGSVVVMLLAPQSGTDLRQGLASKVQEIVDAGRQATVEQRQQLRAEYREAIRIPIPIAESDQA